MFFIYCSFGEVKLIPCIMTKKIYIEEKQSFCLYMLSTEALTKKI